MIKLILVLSITMILQLTIILLSSRNHNNNNYDDNSNTFIMIYTIMSYCNHNNTTIIDLRPGQRAVRIVEAAEEEGPYRSMYLKPV